MNASQNEIIAPDFKPTFRSCDLHTFCNNPSPIAKINFFKKYKPFTELCPSKQNTPKKGLLTADEKEIMQNEIDKCLSDNSLKFDDEAIINLTLKNMKTDDDLPVSFVMSNLNMTDDDDDDDVDDDYGYETPESDIDTFKKSVEQEKKKNIDYLIQLKTKKARFYTSTQRGIKIEKNVILKVNKDLNYNFIKNKQLKEEDFGTFKIHGIIDGIDHEKRTIIEVKSRNNFDLDKCTITEKEKIQALVYMKLYGYEKCLFVESGPEGQQKINEIKWDEKKFDLLVKRKLENFTYYARSLTRADFEELISKAKKNNKT